MLPSTQKRTINYGWKFFCKNEPQVGNGPLKKKTQEDYPTTENHGKERVEDHSTSVAYSGNRCRVVFLSFFTMIFL